MTVDDKNDEVYRISTGDPSTLGTYLKLTKAVFGPESNAVKFLEAEIEDHEKGKDEVVIQHETQMIYLLGNLCKSDVDIDAVIASRRKREAKDTV